jgi:hypothetical protein
MAGPGLTGAERREKMTIEKFYGFALTRINGVTLATARDNYVEIWCQPSLYEQAELTDAYDAREKVTSITGYGNGVVIGTGDGNVFILPVKDGRFDKGNTQKFRAYKYGEIKCLDVSSSGLIATVGEYGGLKLWDASLSPIANTPGGFESVGFSPNGESVVFGGDNGLFVMPLSSLTPIQVTSCWTRFDTFTPNGHIIATQFEKTVVLDNTNYSVLLEANRSYAYVVLDEGKVITIKRNTLTVFNSLQDFISGRDLWHDNTVLGTNDVPTGIVVSDFKINISFI